MTGEVEISCRALSKGFGELAVLRNLKLDILKGETLVVLGQSGSGKSVLLKHLNGLLRPDAGYVVFENREISALPESQLVSARLKISMLFQGGALFDSLNVEDNVAFPLDRHRLCPRAERADRVAELLDLVALGGTQKRMPSELSGGMRKRAALARALAIRPSVMLYDEPTTGLDPVTAQQINELIRGLQERFGLTSVVVTHDIASATFVADRMAFLYDGAIRQIGSVEELGATDDPIVSKFLSLGSVGPR